MTEDHIGVKIDGVIYVKLEDVKPMRARIEKLEAALRDLSDGWECCTVSIAMRTIARKALEGKE